MLQSHGKISVLQGGLTQIQFSIQDVYLYIKTLPISTVDPTLKTLPNLGYFLQDGNNQLRSHTLLDLPADAESDI